MGFDVLNTNAGRGVIIYETPNCVEDWTEAPKDRIGSGYANRVDEILQIKVHNDKCVFEQISCG